MESALFEEWVRALDKTFFNENLKITLIIDNCPADRTIGNLCNVCLIFLPPKTTSVSQPMNQGVIKCLKTNYCRRLVRMMITKRFTKISIPRALQLLVASWNDVTKSTVVNCFREAKISKENQIVAVADIDEPFRALQEDLYELQQCHLDLVPEKLTTEDVVHIDSNIITTEVPKTDEEILASATLEAEYKENEKDGI